MRPHSGRYQSADSGSFAATSVAHSLLIGSRPRETGALALLRGRSGAEARESFLARAGTKSGDCAVPLGPGRLYAYTRASSPANKFGSTPRPSRECGRRVFVRWQRADNTQVESGLVRVQFSLSSRRRTANNIRRRPTVLERCAGAVQIVVCRPNWSEKAINGQSWNRYRALNQSRPSPDQRRRLDNECRHSLPAPSLTTQRP